MEDWAEIRRLHRSEEIPIKAIVRKLGVSRNAVRRALAADAPRRRVVPERPVGEFRPSPAAEGVHRGKRLRTSFARDGRRHAGASDGR